MVKSMLPFLHIFYCLVFEFLNRFVVRRGKELKKAKNGNKKKDVVVIVFDLFWCQLDVDGWEEGNALELTKELIRKLKKFDARCQKVRDGRQKVKTQKKVQNLAMKSRKWVTKD